MSRLSLDMTKWAPRRPQEHADRFYCNEKAVRSFRKRNSTIEHRVVVQKFPVKQLPFAPRPGNAKFVSKLRRPTRALSADHLLATWPSSLPQLVALALAPTK